jgi:hypothetical protein
MFSLMATMLGAVQQVEREHARGAGGWGAAQPKGVPPTSTTGRATWRARAARVLPAALAAGVVVLVGVARFYF